MSTVMFLLVRHLPRGPRTSSRSDVFRMFCRPEILSALRTAMSVDPGRPITTMMLFAYSFIFETESRLRLRAFTTFSSGGKSSYACFLPPLSGFFLSRCMANSSRQFPSLMNFRRVVIALTNLNQSQKSVFICMLMAGGVWL